MSFLNKAFVGLSSQQLMWLLLSFNIYVHFKLVFENYLSIRIMFCMEFNLENSKFHVSPQHGLSYTCLFWEYVFHCSEILELIWGTVCVSKPCDITYTSVKKTRTFAIFVCIISVSMMTTRSSNYIPSHKGAQ